MQPDVADTKRDGVADRRIMDTKWVPNLGTGNGPCFRCLACVSTAGVPILGTFFGPGFGHHFRAQPAGFGPAQLGVQEQHLINKKRGNEKSTLSTASAASSMGLCGRHPNRNPKKRRIFAAHLRQRRCRFRSTFGGTMLATGNCRPSFSGKACVAHWRSYLAMTATSDGATSW